MTTALLACIVVFLTGAALFWANPYRLVNRAVFGCSLIIVLWLGCWHVASAARSLFFVKCTCAAGALVSIGYWLVKEAILSPSDIYKVSWYRRNYGWFVIPLILSVMPFTESFIPSSSTALNKLYGVGYYVYMVVNLGLYVLLILQAFSYEKAVAARRLELQVWLGGGSVMFVAEFILMALSTITDDPVYRRTEPLIVLVFFAGLAYAITNHRIFDARQLALVGIQQGALVLIVGVGAYINLQIFERLMPESLAFFLTIAAGLFGAQLIHRWLDRWLKIYPEGNAARQATFSAAQRETRVDKLESSFSSVLFGWGHTSRAIILSGNKEVVSGAGVTLANENGVLTAIREMIWVTPERLARERPSSSKRLLGTFMRHHELGVVVICDGPSLSLVVGVGIPASRRPYTYPQVTQLIELASIMESALERAHFSAKVQHTEQLATVGLLGASLAHEIRNPLVSIKTFVQLLPSHHHDARFREKFFKLIGDEVSRIDQLTQQLLDLSSPRTYMAEMVDLHPLLMSSIELVSAKAAHRNVQLVTEFQAQPDKAYTDASAAKQVMLNLCFNAIQAVEAKDSDDRWVKVATRNTSRGVEMVVADNGPGIAPEIRPKLFQPFQTTKSTGFGLGLAICSDILANLNASISVDPPEPGRGATFRVTFPCQPSSS